MGDGLVNGPHEVATDSEIMVWPHSRMIARTSNGVICVVYHQSSADESSGNGNSVVMTSADDGQTWSQQASISGTTSGSLGRENPCIAVDGSNRLILVQTDSGQSIASHFITWDVNSDGTLSNQTTTDFGNTGPKAVTVDSTGTAWVAAKDSPLFESDEIVLYDETVGFDPSDVQGTWAVPGEPNRFTIQAGPSDDIHVSTVTGTPNVMYNRFDVSAGSFNGEETVVASEDFAEESVTLCFQEDDEPVIYPTVHEAVYHRDAGTWETETFTSAAASGTKGGTASTWDNTPGDGDIGALYVVSGTPNEIRWSYGRLDNNTTGSQFREEDILVEESDSVRGAVCGYQFYHSEYTDSDEIDCLYVDENGTSNPRLLYFSAPTPLRVSATEEATTTEEPGDMTVTPGTATMSGTVGSEPAQEPALSTESPRTRNMSSESVQTTEGGDAAVTATATISSVVGENASQEPGGSATATRSVTLTEGPNATAEPSPSTNSPATTSFQVETLTHDSPSPAVNATATASPTVDSHATVEPGDIIVNILERTLPVSASELSAVNVETPINAGGLTRSMSRESVDQIERISAIVRASGVIAPSVDDPAAAEPEISTTSGGITGTMGVESTFTTGPSMNALPSATIEPSQADLTVSEISAVFSAGVSTLLSTEEALSAAGLSPSVNASVEIDLLSESNSSEEPGDISINLAPISVESAVEEIDAMDIEASFEAGELIGSMTTESVAQSETAASLQATRSVSASEGLIPANEPSIATEPGAITSNFGAESSSVVEPGVFVLRASEVSDIIHTASLDGLFRTSRQNTGTFITNRSMAGTFLSSLSKDGSFVITRTEDGTFVVTRSVDGEVD